MDKKTEKLLIKKAKKLSKWYEGVFVNPIFWKVNEKPYYMAFHLLWGIHQKLQHT